MRSFDLKLSDDDADFVNGEIASGRFNSFDELIHVVLRAFREDERDDAAKLERLRRLAKAGFDQLDRCESVTVEPGGIRAFLEEIVAERRARDARGK